MNQKGIIIAPLLLVLFIFAIIMCNHEESEESEDTKGHPNVEQSTNSKDSASTNIVHNNIINNSNSNYEESLYETIYLISENSNLEQWNDFDIQKANTAANNNSLSKEEKQIILYTNLARLNGEKFCELYVSPAANKHPNNSYIKSLISDLTPIKDLPMLYPNDILIKAAQYHSKDLSSCEDIGHDSSDGTPFHKRLMKFGYNKPCGENVAGGRHDALGVVLDLLIDEGIPNVGHRKNILDKNYNAIGVSRNTHPKYDFNFVMDFGQD